MSTGVTRAFTIAVLVLVALGVALALSIVGTPTQAHQAALDQRRIDDLNRIRIRLSDMYTSDRKIPDRLHARASEALDLVDPESGARYPYRRESATRYRLCAVFAQESEVKDPQALPWSESWSHGRGLTCFALDASKQAERPRQILKIHASVNGV